MLITSLVELCVATVARLPLREGLTGLRVCLPALSNPRVCAAKHMHEVTRIAATRSVLAQQGHDRVWPATYSCQSRHRRRQATVSSSLTPGCKPGPTLSLQPFASTSLLRLSMAVHRYSVSLPRLCSWTWCHPSRAVSASRVIQSHRFRHILWHQYASVLTSRPVLTLSRFQPVEIPKHVA